MNNLEKQYNYPNKEKAFLYSFLSGLKINLIGVLALGDVIAVFYSLRSIKSWKLLFNSYPEIGMVVKALLLFVGIQLVSDLYNHTTVVNTLRGGANILMAVFVIVFLTKMLSESLYSAAFIFLGFSLSALIFGFKGLEHNKVSLDDMFFVKIRLMPLINNLIFAVLLFFNSKPKKSIRFQSIGLFLIIYGIISMLMGARSNSIFFFVPGLIVIYKSFFGYITRKRLMYFIPLLLVVVQLCYSVFVYNVLSGSIKSPQMRGQLKRIENPYNPVDLLFFGRIQIYGAIVAISDKPFLGHGSWAHDKDGKYNLIIARLYHGEKYIQKQLAKNGKDSLQIPTHSILTSSWVSAGFFAFISMLFVFGLVLKKFLNLFLNREFQDSIFFPILTVLIVQLVWQFLFSPIQEIRTVAPLNLVLILLCYRKYSFSGDEIFAEKNRSLQVESC